MERIFLCFDLRAMRGASVAIRSRPRRPLARSLRVRPMRTMVQGETPPPVFRNGGDGAMNCPGTQVATVYRLVFVGRGTSNPYLIGGVGSLEERTSVGEGKCGS